MKSPTMALAEFVAGLDYDKLPPRCLAAVRTSLLDTIGCGLYGATTPWGQAVSQLVKEQRGAPEATLWANDCRVPAPNAALALGTMVHAFELDDYHSGAKLHPGAAVVPAAVGVAEREGASGRQLLTAVAAGYETMIRISLGTGTVPARLRGWHLTGICGTFGAAAAAAKLLGLDALRTANALGLAGSQSAGLMAFTADGSNSKRLHPGRAAHGGVLAALLAQRGFTGPTQILEYEDGGFCKTYSDEYNLTQLTEGLGEVFQTEGVSLKPYACCGSIHSSIDASRELARRYQIDPKDIEKILVYNSSVVKLQCSWYYEPVSPMQAQMNIEYCVAVAILEGQALPEQFTPQKIADPSIVELARRVEFVVDPEIEQLYPKTFPGKVEIVLKDGRRYAHRVEGPKGSPQNPMAAAEVAEKFIALAGGVIGPERARQVLELAAHLEEVPQVEELTRLLA